MTKQEWNNMSREDQIKVLDPVIELAVKKLIHGILSKNIVRHFINRGFPQGAAQNIVDIAIIRAEKFSHYKIK